MAKKKSVPTYYASVHWTASDVKTLRPKWQLARCERALSRIERQMQDRLIELGWEVMEHLLVYESGK